VKKTTIYLPDDLKRKVEARARAESRSEAEVIRDAIAAAVAPRAARPRVPLSAEPDGRRTRRRVARRVRAVILLDTSGLLAALFPDQQRHEECARVLIEAQPPLIVSPFVLAETDYLIQKFAGLDTELLFLDDVANGAYLVVEFGPDDVAAARRIIAKSRSLRIGLADASIAVLAQRYDVFDVLTLAERHFRAIRPAPRKNFRILPADA
jgi:predicted nucleic acid-binding protein